MPAGQACLGKIFSVLEVQPLLSNPGPMFVHSQALSASGETLDPPPLFLTVLHPELLISLRRVEQRSYFPLFLPCPTHLDLLTCQGIRLPLPAQCKF